MIGKLSTARQEQIIKANTNEGKSSGVLLNYFQDRRDLSAADNKKREHTDCLQRLTKTLKEQILTHDKYRKYKSSFSDIYWHIIMVPEADKEEK